jgi:hypothetical protein
MLYKPGDRTVLAIFLAVTLLAAGLISKLTRSLATEVDASADAGLPGHRPRVLLSTMWTK